MLSKNNKNSDSVKPSGLDSRRLMQIDDVVDRAFGMDVRLWRLTRDEGVSLSFQRWRVS